MTTAAPSSKTSTSPVGEFSRGKTIFVLAVVIGCFAILWPKIFYPMLTASLNVGDESEQCCDVISEKDVNAYKLMNEICANIMKRESSPTPGDTGGPPPVSSPTEQPKSEESGQGQQQQKWSSSAKKTYTPPKIRLTTAQLCRNEILKTCGLDVLVLIQENPVITKEYKASLAKLRQYNTSQCLKDNYGVDFQTVGLPRRFKNSDAHLPPSHMRPERPIHFHRPEMVHPAMRERGSAIPQTIPQRTLEKEARPGPFPGVRPPVGGAGYQAPAPKGGGTMGIIMPLYTIAIVVFFVYTIMKILFRKSEDKQPLVKDFHMDPEHRKYVFSEEYTPGSERSLKDQYNKEDRDAGIRRRSNSGKRFQEQRSRLDSSEDTQLESRNDIAEPAAATSSNSPENIEEIQLFEQITPMKMEPRLSITEKFTEEIKLAQVPMVEKSLGSNEEPQVLFNELKPLETLTPLLKEEKYPETIVLEKIPVTEKRRKSSAAEIETNQVELYNQLHTVETSAPLSVEEKHPESIKFGEIPVTEKQLSPTDALTATKQQQETAEELQLFNELKPVQTSVALAVEEKFPEELKLQKKALVGQEINTDPGLELFNELKPVQTIPAMAVEPKFPESMKLEGIVLKGTKLNAGPGIELFNELKPVQTEPALRVEEKYPGDIKLEEIILIEEKINTDPGLELYSDLKPVLTTPALAIHEKYPEKIKLGKIFAVEKASTPPAFTKQPEDYGVQLFSDLKPVQTTPSLAIQEKFPEQIKLGRVFAIEKQLQPDSETDGGNKQPKLTKETSEKTGDTSAVKEINQEDKIVPSGPVGALQRDEQLKLIQDTEKQLQEASATSLIGDAQKIEQQEEKENVSEKPKSPKKSIKFEDDQEDSAPVKPSKKSIKFDDDQEDSTPVKSSKKSIKFDDDQEDSTPVKSSKKLLTFEDDEDPAPAENASDDTEPIINYEDVASLAGEIDEIIDLAESIASDIAEQMAPLQAEIGDRPHAASKPASVEEEILTPMIDFPNDSVQIGADEYFIFPSSQKTAVSPMHRFDATEDLTKCGQDEEIQLYTSLNPIEKSSPLAVEEKFPNTLVLGQIPVMEQESGNTSRKQSLGEKPKKVTFSEPTLPSPDSEPATPDMYPSIGLTHEDELKVDLLEFEDERVMELECLNDSESESTVQPSPAPQSPEDQKQRPDQHVSFTSSEGGQDVSSAQVVQNAQGKASAVEEPVVVKSQGVTISAAPELSSSSLTSETLKGPTSEPDVSSPPTAETASEPISLPEVPAPKPAIKKEVKILEVPKILEGLSAETTEEEYEEEEEEEEEEDEELPVRPPTPPRSTKQRQSTDNSAAIANYAQQLANRIIKQGEETAATIIEFESAKNARPAPGPERTTSPIVTSVVNFEGTLEMENGHKLRSPTPPNIRSLSMSPSPPLAPSEEIEKDVEVPSIFLQGPIPSSANKVLVSALSDSQDELRHLKEDEDEQVDDEADQDSVSAPVVLSGKVTLSVIAGGPADDQPTEATSLSVDDYAKALSAHSEPKQQLTCGQGSDLEEEDEGLEDEEELEPNERARTSDLKKKASSTGKAQKETKDDEATHYTTADIDDGPLNEEGGDINADETAEDISALEGLEDGRLDDILPSDEEEEYSGEEEEEEEDPEDEQEEEEEEEEEEDDEEDQQKVSNKGPPV